MSREAGKRRAQRIQLDYHKSRGFIYWSRWYATILAVVVGGAYAFYASTDNGVTHMSTGKLSQVHSHFESNCEACHSAELGETLAQDAWSIDLSASIEHRRNSCNECHKVQGHFHDHLANPELDEDCTLCHTEHMGREFDITHIANRGCVSCHGELSKACIPTKATNLNDVTQFDIDSHAVSFDSGKTFRSLGEDKGRIKFDHAQHMLPGQVNEGSRGAFTYEMLSVINRERYGDGVGAIQLSCDDCHVPVTQGSPNAFNAKLGLYYAPVDYEQHCAACHGLNYVGQSGEQLPLPHAAPWDEVNALLRTKIAGGMLNENSIRSFSTPLSDIPLPGKIDTTLQNPLPANGGSVESVDAQTSFNMSLAIDLVREQCSKCHNSEDITNEAILRLRQSEESLIPTEWLTRGGFNHSAHIEFPRLTDGEKSSNQKVAAHSSCLFCHQITNDPADPPTDQTRVMIGGPETCVPCHQSDSGASLSTMEVQGKSYSLLAASDSCTECHRYHWTRDDEVYAP